MGTSCGLTQMVSQNLYLGDWKMSYLAWIVLGLLAGFIGSKIVNKTGEGILLDIVLGIVGALVGGWLFNTFGAAGLTGLQHFQCLSSNQKFRPPSFTQGAYS
jgi:uncharacterized membrane protein YeaQ/YmgE (transglycosylase-associated protein family)